MKKRTMKSRPNIFRWDRRDFDMLEAAKELSKRSAFKFKVERSPEEHGVSDDECVDAIVINDIYTIMMVSEEVVRGLTKKSVPTIMYEAYVESYIPATQWEPADSDMVEIGKKQQSFYRVLIDVLIDSLSCRFGEVLEDILFDEDEEFLSRLESDAFDRSRQ